MNDRFVLWVQQTDSHVLVSLRNAAENARARRHLKSPTGASSLRGQFLRATRAKDICTGYVDVRPPPVLP